MARPNPAGETPDHGTHARYINAGCRCSLCTQAYHAASPPERNTVLKLVDGTEALTHLHQLLASGATLASVARASGVPRRTLGRLITPRPTGKHPRITGAHAQAILQLSTTPTDRKRIEATEVRKLLEELICSGWRQNELAHLLGYRSPNALHRFIHERQPTIRISTAQRIHALYEELSVQQPPRQSSEPTKRKKAPKLDAPVVKASDDTEAPNPRNGFYDPRYDRSIRKWPEDLLRDEPGMD